MSSTVKFDFSDRIFGIVSIFAIGVLISSLTYGWSMMFGKVSGEYPQQISVEAKGEVEVAPDLAVLILGVEAKEESAALASQKNNEIMNAILASLKEKGVKEEDITTNNYTLYPRQTWNGEQYLDDGFTASQNVHVKIRELDKVGEILTAATDSGATNVGGVNFTVEDQDAAIQEARVEAIAKAKEKADVIERESGIKLGKVMSYYEYTDGGFFAKGGGGGEMYANAESADSVVPVIQAGTQTISLTVTFTYKVK